MAEFQVVRQIQYRRIKDRRKKTGEKRAGERKYFFLADILFCKCQDIFARPYYHHTQFIFALHQFSRILWIFDFFVKSKHYCYENPKMYGTLYYY